MRRPSMAAFTLLAVFALLLPALPSAAAGATAWSTTGPSILLDNKAFIAKGISYSPTPIGGSADFPPFQDWFRSGNKYELVWQRDIAPLREMGANVVKTYSWWAYLPTKGDEYGGAPNNLKKNLDGQLNWDPKATEASDHTAFLDALWNGGKDPIYVLIGIAIDAGPCFNNGDTDPTHWGSGPSYRKFYANTAEWAAKKYGSHPAVMGFILGNEMNQEDRLSGTNPTFWPTLNAMAQTVKKNAPGKLVGIAWQGEQAFRMNGSSPMYKLVAENKDFDFWGANVYTGKTFDPFWNFWDPFVAAGYGKPLLITEWGRPTCKVQGGAVVESVEANIEAGDYIGNLWKEIEKNPKRTAGGTVFAWSDEWWKVKKEEVSTALPYKHDAAKDPVWQEECWGLNKVDYVNRDPQYPTDNKGDVISSDKLTQRNGYTALKSLWTAGGYRKPEARLKSGTDAPLLARSKNRGIRSVSENPLLSSPIHLDGTFTSFIGHRISLSLDPGSYLGMPAEWYLVHVGPMGMRQWDPYSASWVTADKVSPLFKAPLEELVDLEIPVGFLYSGANSFTFAVDLEIDGTNDNNHWFSSTNVIVIH